VVDVLKFDVKFMLLQADGFQLLGDYLSGFICLHIESLEVQDDAADVAF
jgi:hypothetical protein